MIDDLQAWNYIGEQIGMEVCCQARSRAGQGSQPYHPRSHAMADAMAIEDVGTHVNYDTPRIFFPLHLHCFLLIKEKIDKLLTVRKPIL
jgi:hypothetical protein